jgi:hypothetical protein
VEHVNDIVVRQWAHDCELWKETHPFWVAPEADRTKAAVLYRSFKARCFAQRQPSVHEDDEQRLVRALRPAPPTPCAPGHARGHVGWLLRLRAARLLCAAAPDAHARPCA